MDITLFEQNIEIKEKIPNHLNREKIIIIRSTNDLVNRKALESKHIDILLDPHIGKRKDFIHHRNAGLNQVLLKFAKQNKIAIGFSFQSVLESKKRAKLIGRMMQNIKLCRKYKIPMVIGSFSAKENQRNFKDIQSFFKILGMKGKEYNNEYIKKKLDYKRRYIKKGVMLAK
jgi:RNase P/RNase MRP subunit p30